MYRTLVRSDALSRLRFRAYRPQKFTSMTTKEQPQSVLYVDDDPSIRDVFQTALCVIGGLTVHVAGCGERAIAYAHDLAPDLILLDVAMPGLDGPCTLKQMRSSARLARIPVIFLTHKVGPAEVARLRLLGAIGVIAKPFNPMRIAENVFAMWTRANTTRIPPGADRAGPSVPVHIGSRAPYLCERR